MSKLVIAIIVVAVLGAGYFWYASQNKEAANETVNQENLNTNTLEENLPQEETPQTREFNITGSNFEFSIKEMTVNQGDTVRINFYNNGGFHDWVLDEFNARTEKIGDGESQTIEFVADKTGTFEYYCSVGEHRQMGMKGNLIVK